MPGRGDAAPVRQRTSTASSGAASSFRLSIGGSIRLNDLLNDDDDYGFAEEATEASFLLGEEASGVPDEVSVEVEEYERHSSRAVGEEKQADSAVSSGFAPPAMVELIEEHVPLAASTAHPQTSRSSEAADEWPEKRSLGGASIGSSDSSSRSEANGERMTASASSTTTPGEGGVKEKSSGKIGQLLDRAKNKLTAKKNEKRSITPESSHDASATSNGSVERRRNFAETKVIDSSHARVENLSEDLTTSESAKASTDSSPSLFSLVTGHLARLPFYNARLYSLGVLLALTVAWPGFISGLLWGAYISSVAFLFFFVSDKHEEKKVELEDLPDLLVEEVAEEALEGESDRVMYKGWMNELRAAQKYSPATYHVNACRCVLVRLDATTLRISRPARAVLKHAFHEDPTLTQPQPTMTAQSIYDLTNATVSLRPRRLAKRRWWSRKYPIYIRLDGGDDSRIFKRERTPSFMKRSISMHPEPHGTASIPSSSSTVFDRTLRASISMDDRRPSVFDDTETDTTEDEDDFSLSSNQAGGATNVLIDRRHSQSTSEVDKQSEGGAVGEKSQRLSSKRKGIFLFARAAREKERWFHLLREACARARLEAARASRASELRDSLSNRNQSVGSTGSAREFVTGPNRPVPPPRRRAQSEFFNPASLPPSDTSIPSSTKDEEKKEDPLLSQPTQSSSTRATATAYDEYAKYRTNRGEFEKVMADAMRLLAMTATTSSTTTPVPTPNGGEKEKRPNQLKNKQQQQQQEAAQQSDTVSVDLGSYRWKPGASPDANSDLVSAVNAIASRIFFDFCRDSFWCQQVKEKIQTKLATIHLPYFIEQLELSALDLGTSAPHIESVYAPTFDQWGLWVDFEVKYSGGIRLTLETRVNLLRLRTGEERQGADSEPSTPLLRPSGSTGELSSSLSRRGATRYSDEDLPESPEDSPDEDFGSKTNQEGTTRERAGSKLVSLVERAAQTSIFQKAARHPKISKIMTELAETRLQLNVEIEQLEGTMTVNLPGPPSDRIWYAFRRPPRISIRAVPQVGDRSVDWTTVSDWIESRLRLLLERNLVCPNMDDVIVPVMSGNELLHMGYNV